MPESIRMLHSEIPRVRRAIESFDELKPILAENIAQLAAEGDDDAELHALEQMVEFAVGEIERDQKRGYEINQTCAIIANAFKCARLRVPDQWADQTPKPEPVDPIARSYTERRDFFDPAAREAELNEGATIIDTRPGRPVEVNIDRDSGTGTVKL